MMCPLKNATRSLLSTAPSLISRQISSLISSHLHSLTNRCNAKFSVISHFSLLSILTPDIKPRLSPGRSVIPWSRTVGLCRSLSAVHTPVLTSTNTTGSAREKLRPHAKKRVTTMEDITGTVTVPTILLIASDLWLDFHMHQVGD